MPFPPDYYQRVYAGILGKIIGVYLGRPFEGWAYEQIMAELGEIEYYVNHRTDLPLRNRQIVVTDDDISGTFTFLRAMPDYYNSLDLTPAQIGQTWLNYIIENRTILWWGGLGNSTEHTAYLRLKDGIPAPLSGSMTLNSQIVAEQIGAQIFIEGWGLIAPGDPELAADLARRAASVSHDGEAIFGAQIMAALTALAFIEEDLNRLLDAATCLIPQDSLTQKLIAEIRNWHAADPRDWHKARTKLAQNYGYEKYGGNCHIIPNHGLNILSLLYGNGDFSRAQTIVNTCGWDTDCNAANVGCVMGVWKGLSAFDTGPDWRGPVADRLYIPTADAGRAISDAVRETDFVLEIAYALQGKTWEPPKDGARFHFSLPGSVQGFKTQGNATLENLPHPSGNSRALGLNYQMDANTFAGALTPTFIPEEAIKMPGYELLASPTLYPGQIVRAQVVAATENSAKVEVGIQLQSYAQKDQVLNMRGTGWQLSPGDATEIQWQVPGLSGFPTAQIGIFIHAQEPARGRVYLDSLTWDGPAQVKFCRPQGGGTLWKRQWVDAVDYFEDQFGEAFRLVQNRGRGLAITGTREWRDYAVETTLKPHLAKAFGLAVRVQGLERYYGLLLAEGGTVKLVKRLDGEHILASKDFKWILNQPYTLRLAVSKHQICAWIDDELIFDHDDMTHPLESGGIALVCEEGRVGTDLVSVSPVDQFIP